MKASSSVLTLAVLFSAICGVAAPAVAGPGIRFQSNAYDFGKVPTGEVIKHDFVFTNTGNATLEISDVHPGCGCTTAGTWDHSVAPGRTGRIPLQFNSAGFSGAVHKSATVTCNDPQTPTALLEISGTVWTPIQVTPSIVVFNVRSDALQPETRRMQIENNTEAPLKLEDLKCTNSNLTFALKPIVAGKSFELEITARPPFQPGTFVIPFTAATSLKEVPVLNMSAYLIVQPPVTLSPAQLVLPDNGPAGRVTNVVMVRNQTSQKLRLSQAAINIPGAEVEVMETEPGQLANLSVIFPAGLRLQLGQNYEITAHTGIDSYPVIKIPVRQFATTSEPSTTKLAPGIVPQSRAVPKRSSLAR